MRRRAALSLPYGDQVADLVTLLGADAPVPAPADPARLTRAVLHHNLSAFAAAALEEGRLELPAEEGRLIRDAAAVRSLTSRALRTELAAIEPLLADACGTRPLLVKGPAAARLYRDARSRAWGRRPARRARRCRAKLSSRTRDSAPLIPRGGGSRARSSRGIGRTPAW